MPPKLYEEENEDIGDNVLDSLTDWDYDWLPEYGYEDDE